MGELPLLGNQGMPLWSERILLALLEGHPLAGKEVVYWTDLRGETVLLSQYDPGRELEDLLMSKLVSPEDRPKIARHDVSRGIIKSLIAAGFGVSLVASIISCWRAILRDHQADNHSGLLEPRGTSTVRKEPRVRDMTTWSVSP
jgi:DNA-binding transcriptional LysR family regulator